MYHWQTSGGYSVRDLSCGCIKGLHQSPGKSRFDYVNPDFFLLTSIITWNSACFRAESTLFPMDILHWWKMHGKLFWGCILLFGDLSLASIPAFVIWAFLNGPLTERASSLYFWISCNSWWAALDIEPPRNQNLKRQCAAMVDQWIGAMIPNLGVSPLETLARNGNAPIQKSQNSP